MDQYIETITNFLENNDWNLNESEFILLQYDIVDKMEADLVGIEAIQPILELMEKYSLVEFGTPGPLTHFIESFYKAHKTFYENLLVQSVKNNPAVHTIWLLNRIINASEEEKAKEYIQILKSISNNKNLPKDIQSVAEGFLEYHDEL